MTTCTCGAHSHGNDPLSAVHTNECALSQQYVPKDNSTWKHRNGNVYTVLFITNDNQRLDHPPDVVYQGDNGLKWSRRLSDWHRSFTEIVPAAPVQELNETGAEPTMQQVLEVMIELGGSFVQAVARLYQIGDGTNRHLLKSAFSHYFANYARMWKEKQKAKLPTDTYAVDEAVIYIPLHANGDPTHKDCEVGYVKSWNDTFIFVRFGTSPQGQACRPEDLTKYPYNKD